MTVSNKKFRATWELPEYKVRSGMIQRCTNPKSNGYHRYGGRGIKVCDRWLEDFLNFYADMGPRPSDDHTLERINNDGNYEPGNCKWATWDEQANNKSSNWTDEQIAQLKAMWESYCTAEEISEALGKSVDTVRQGAHRFNFRRDKGVMTLSRSFPDLVHLIHEQGVEAFREASQKAVSKKRAQETMERRRRDEDRLLRFYQTRDVLQVSSKPIIWRAA